MSSREFQKKRVKSEVGLAQDIEEMCRRYKDGKAKIGCVVGSRNALALMHTGLNQKAQITMMKATGELKDVEKELKEEYGRPEKIRMQKLTTHVVDR